MHPDDDTITLTCPRCSEAVARFEVRLRRWRVLGGWIALFAGSCLHAIGVPVTCEGLTRFVARDALLKRVG